MACRCCFTTTIWSASPAVKRRWRGQPFAELAKLDAGAWFGPGFAGEPIPSLEQALALAVELGFTPNIEIKPTPRRDAATAAAVVETVVARHWPTRMPRPIAWRPLIGSFSAPGARGRAR